MDERERQILEREVESHREQIASLRESLRDIVENLSDVTDAPQELIRAACFIRMALKGREGAVEVGAARLESLLRADDSEES